MCPPASGSWRAVRRLAEPESSRKWRFASRLAHESVPPDTVAHVVLSHRVEPHRDLLSPNSDSLRRRRAHVSGVVMYVFNGFSPVASPPLAAGIAVDNRRRKRWRARVKLVDPREVDDVVTLRVDRVDTDREVIPHLPVTAVGHLHARRSDELLAAVVDNSRDLTEGAIARPRALWSASGFGSETILNAGAPSAGESSMRQQIERRSGRVVLDVRRLRVHQPRLFFALELDVATVSKCRDAYGD